MDASQWSQQVVSNLGRPMEEVSSTTPPNNNNNPNNNSTNSRGTIPPQQQQEQASIERRTRPQKDQILNCPRCHSTNTKFCYYNNYSLTQPRYFCKTCRRYWTQGGTLRSVPVGGGSRKNKRSLSSTSSTPPSLQPPPPPLSSSTTTPPITSLSHLLTSSQNPNFKFLEAQDLNLSFPIQGLFHHQLPKIEGNNNNNNNINNNIVNSESKGENYELPININGNISTNNSCTTTNNTTNNNNNNNSTPFSALELLRSGMASRGSLNNPFIPMSIPDSNTFYQSGYPNLQEFKTGMNLFSSPSHEIDDNNGHQNNNDNNNNNNNSSNNESNSNTGARLLFPFADMNKLAATNTHQQHHDDHHIDVHDQSNKGNIGNDDDDHHHQNLHSGYWSGMLGGGPW